MILLNPNFKGVEFDPLLRDAGSNSFTMSPSRWIEITNAIGLISKSGANGGTYAQRDIAFKFASWVSVEFELYLVKEFQRLKEAEQKLLGWSAKRELAKINYRIHTDAIKYESKRELGLFGMQRIVFPCHHFPSKPLMWIQTLIDTVCFVHTKPWLLPETDAGLLL